MRLDHLLSKETSEDEIHLRKVLRSAGCLKAFTLFNLEGTSKVAEAKPGKGAWFGEEIWGFSSAGRAPALQAGGQRFDPANLHHVPAKRSVANETGQ